VTRTSPTTRWRQAVDEARPLGRGYDAPWEFLSGYADPRRDPASAAPDLDASLRELHGLPRIDRWLRTLGSNPLCLIEGIAAPSNGAVLRRFLAAYGVSAPRIVAIDLINLAAFMRARHLAMTSMEFLVADASRLRGLFVDGSVDLVVQDFLLNCAPHGRHEPILREAARILRAGGLAIINFTDHRGVGRRPRLGREALASRYGIHLQDEAYCLRDLAGGDGRLARLRQELAGTLLPGPAPRTCTLVTPPHGNFEFYSPRSRIERLVRASGFKISGQRRSCGLDGYGNTCWRYRTLAQKRADG
jgi:SAM-dependent methyltransferase